MITDRDLQQALQHAVGLVAAARRERENHCPACHGTGYAAVDLLGGHGICAVCDGAKIIDTSPLRQLHIDLERAHQRAWPPRGY